MKDKTTTELIEALSKLLDDLEAADDHLGTEFDHLTERIVTLEERLGAYVHDKVRKRLFALGEEVPE